GSVDRQLQPQSRFFARELLLLRIGWLQLRLRSGEARARTHRFGWSYGYERARINRREIGNQGRVVGRRTFVELRLLDLLRVIDGLRGLLLPLNFLRSLDRWRRLRSGNPIDENRRMGDPLR